MLPERRTRAALSGGYSSAQRATDAPVSRECRMQFLLIDVAAVFTGLFGFWAVAALTDAVRARMLLARRERTSHGLHSH